jgi:hypothetical protein
MSSGCSKRLSSKAAGESKPESYPQGYVENFDEPRTKLGDFFSILLDVHCFVHIMQRRFGDLAGPAAALCHNVVQVCRV